MTAELPDPKAIQSWEDAFKHPIPTVRKIEQRLRHNADDNRDKLRNLVGASYRDLLGTAEQIIAMDETMTRVEDTLGQVGQKCNSAAVERLFRSYEKLEMGYRAQEREELSFAAQVSILQVCPPIISRLLKSRSYLPAAKVLVLSRLVHKALSVDNKATPFLDKLVRRLTSRRRKLLSAIKSTFADDTVGTQELVDTMSAYSLATSSTTADTLKHFHNVRRDTIHAMLNETTISEGEDTELSHSDAPLHALRLYVSTITQTIRIFPSSLAAALAKFKAQPLLSDPSVRSIPELNLDGREEWITLEVRNFAPWPRTTGLDDAERQKILQAWASSTLEIFLAGLRSNLSAQKHLEDLISTRRSLLETWMRSSNTPLFRTSRGRQPPIGRKDVLSRLRQLLIEVISEKIQSHTSSLSNIVTSIKKGLSADDELAEIAPSLWASDVAEIPLRDGGREFKEAVVDRFHGRTQAVTTISNAFREWSGAIERAQVALRTMRDLRWDDEFDDLEDDFMDDGEEDDEDTDEAMRDYSRIQIVLGGEDPNTLDQALNDGLEAAMKSMRGEIEKILERLRTIPSAERDAKLQRTVYLLRSLREIRSSLPASSVPVDTNLQRQFVDADFLASTSGIGPLFVNLDAILAELIARQPVASFDKALSKYSHSDRRLPLVELWEGDPKLPTSPTPLAIRLLKGLTAEMSSQGSDLWCRAAKCALKSWVAEELGKSFQASVNVLRQGSEKTTASGEPADGGKATEERTDTAEVQGLRQQRLVALFYDASYLACALLPEHRSGASQDCKFVDAVRNASGLDKPSVEKISKSATDYWKRTYLLFGTLT